MKVENLSLMNLALHQYSGSAFFEGDTVMNGRAELAQGLLNMEGSFSQAMDLIQNNGDSTIICQGDASDTMQIEVNGGLASVGLDASEGCLLHYERSGGGLIPYFSDADAFPDLSQPAGSFSVGDEKTAINVKTTGGALAVGNRLRIKPGEAYKESN